MLELREVLRELSWLLFPVFCSFMLGEVGSKRFNFLLSAETPMDDADLEACKLDDATAL